MDSIVNVITQTAIFGTVLTLVAFCIGIVVNKKLKIPCLSPLLIGMGIVVAVLLVLDIPYYEYRESSRYISFFLAPATVCLAIPLYEQITLLKKNISAVFIGIFVGVMTSGFTILLLSWMFGLSSAHYATLLPKSITTAMGIGLAEVLDGAVPSLTIAAIFITGVFGNIMAHPLCKLLKIKDPVSKGLAIGTSAHVMGTVKAYEMGEVEGAVSGLAVAVAGLMTVIAANFFVLLY